MLYPPEQQNAPFCALFAPFLHCSVQEPRNGNWGMPCSNTLFNEVGGHPLNKKTALVPTLMQAMDPELMHGVRV